LKPYGVNYKGADEEVNRCGQMGKIVEKGKGAASWLRSVAEHDIIRQKTRDVRQKSGCPPLFCLDRVFTPGEGSVGQFRQFVGRRAAA